jgi:RNA polymerase primary sigma factor
MPRLLHPPQSPLETYFQEINETPLLSAREERELAHRVEDGDGAARDHMIRSNLRLVVNIARSFAGRGLALPDLIAEGNLGLLRAVEGFDPSMETRFSTYASYWIKQSIKRALDNTSKTIRLPAYMVDLLSKWRRATAQLQEELGREPAVEEVARRLELPKKKVNVIKKALRVCNEAPQADVLGSGRSLDELIPDGRDEAPEAELAEADEMRQIRDMLDRLEPREASVLRMRFGIDGEEPLTLVEIGNRLGLTRERVRQIESAALGKLREELEAA